MNVPQIIILLLTGTSWLLNAYLHGRPRTGKHNVFIIIIAGIINLLILYWGGFFK